MKMQKHLWCRLLAVALLSGALAAQAQTGAAPSTPPSANAPAPETAKPSAAQQPSGQQPPPAAQQSPAQQPPAQKADDSYIIGPADVLAINVWKETEISRSIPVRSDGRISLPLIGDVQAGGRTPRQLQEEIARKLQSFISEPDVTVIVQESRSQKFNVLGQVGKPGSFLLTDSTTVLDAIAMAGGFKDFAKQKQIYVLRQNADGTQVRLPFNYKNVVKGKDLEQNVKLMPRDTVVVP